MRRRRLLAEQAQLELRVAAVLDQPEAHEPLQLALPGGERAQHRAHEVLRVLGVELVLERIGDAGRRDVDGQRHRLRRPATQEHDVVGAAPSGGPVRHEGQVVRLQHLGMRLAERRLVAAIGLIRRFEDRLAAEGAGAERGRQPGERAPPGHHGRDRPRPRPRTARCSSRSLSRSRIVSRLSWVFLPRASASSTFARPSLK